MGCHNERGVGGLEHGVVLRVPISNNNYAWTCPAGRRGTQRRRDPTRQCHRRSSRDIGWFHDGEEIGQLVQASGAAARLHLACAVAYVYCPFPANSFWLQRRIEPQAACRTYATRPVSAATRCTNGMLKKSFHALLSHESWLEMLKLAKTRMP